MSILKFKDSDGNWKHVGVNIKGQDGFSPILEVQEETDETYILSLTDATHNIITPNLKGPKGDTYVLTQADKEEIASLVDLDSKIDKPTEQGTAGQVLGLDENGMTKWVDQQGDSTKDYELLIDWTAEEEVAQIHFYHGDNGQNLSDYNELYVMAMNKKMVTPTTTNILIRIVFGETKNLWQDTGIDIMDSLKSSEIQAYSISKYEKTNIGIHLIMSLKSHNKSSILNNLGLTAFISTTAKMATAFTTEGVPATQNTDTNDLGLIKASKKDDWNEIHIGSYTTCFGIGAQIKIFGRK